MSIPLHAGEMPALPPEADVAQTLLLEDQRVQDVTLEYDSRERLVAKVVPTQEFLIAERELAHSALSRQMLRQWKMIYDRTYRSEEAVCAPNFDAWSSSFTGLAIPQEHMISWLNNSVEWLKKVPHRRVLDIGCGVGLVLEALAPDCIEYRGIDISERAITRLSAWVATQPTLQHVKLATCPAHELDLIDAGSVDLIVLNSIVMYFPDPGYLLTVLRASVERLAPGGRIFLGDLRALGPLPMFLAAVSLARAPKDATVGQVKSQAKARLGLLHELAIDPSLFAGLISRLPRLSSIQFGLKPQNTDRELSGYRYDVMLTFDGLDTGKLPSQLWWNSSWTDLSNLLEKLVRDTPDALFVKAVPNARLTHDLAVSNHLNTMPPETPVVELLALLSHEEAAGIEPNEIATAVSTLGYSAEFCFTSGSEEGRFDALLLRTGSTHTHWPLVEIDEAPSNDPLGAELIRALTVNLQQKVDVELMNPGFVRVSLEISKKAKTIRNLLV